MLLTWGGGVGAGHISRTSDGEQLLANDKCTMIISGCMNS